MMSGVGENVVSSNFLPNPKVKRMNWLEVIHFRATERLTKQFKHSVQHLIDEAEQEGVCDKINVYRRVLVETDMCIHLHHGVISVAKNGSPLGLRIAAALREFGMVNHTVWGKMHCT